MTFDIPGGERWASVARVLDTLRPLLFDDPRRVTYRAAWAVVGRLPLSEDMPAALPAETCEAFAGALRFAYDAYNEPPPATLAQWSPGRIVAAIERELGL